MLILYAFTLEAQQDLPPSAVSVKDSSKKALCAAAEAYAKQHPAEIQRMEDAGAQAMQSPEMQRALLVLMQDTMRTQKQSSGQLGFDLPDSLRAPFAAAVASRQFDSAKAIARKATGDAPVDNARLDIVLKLMEIAPDTLRSFFVAGMWNSDGWQCP